MRSLTLLVTLLLVGCAQLKGGPDKVITPTIPPRFDIAQSASTLRYTLCVNDCPVLTAKTFPDSNNNRLEKINLPSLEEKIKLLKAARSMQNQDGLSIEKTKYRKEIIWFKVNTATPVRTDIRDHIKNLVSYVNGAKKIVIAGRTDNSGLLKTNKNLAEQRAELVHQWLEKPARTEGVAIEALDTRPMCCYLNGNLSAEERKLNRRVEIEYFY